ncbi:MAG: hypothetical protein JW955_16885 [Sedimentisphaerales bacterium]|nr:hypothetical protein [Sedimentisphaerales bacterium]
MEDLVTVYGAIAANVPRVVRHLESHGLHPVVIDDVEKMSPYRSQAYEVRIAVPQVQRDAAICVLGQMEREDEVRLRPAMRKARALVLLLIAALGVVAVVGLLDGRGVWFVGIEAVLAVIGAVALIRWAWKR